MTIAQVTEVSEMSRDGSQPANCSVIVIVTEHATHIHVFFWLFFLLSFLSWCVSAGGGTTDTADNVQWFSDGAPSPGPLLNVTTDLIAEAVAEAGGCPGNPVTVQVDVLPLPTATLSSVPDVLCWGTTGLVSAVPDAGSSVTDWVLPAGTAAPNQAGPGLYTANLLGANGCPSSASFVLEQLPPIDFDLTGPNGACENAPAVLQVTGNHSAASWSTGDSGDLLALTAADGEGPFTVTVELDGWLLSVTECRVAALSAVKEKAAKMATCIRK